MDSNGCRDPLNIVALDRRRQCDDAVPTLLVALKLLAADPRCLQILLAEAPWLGDPNGFNNSNFNGVKN